MAEDSNLLLSLREEPKCLFEVATAPNGRFRVSVIVAAAMQTGTYPGPAAKDYLMTVLSLAAPEGEKGRAPFILRDVQGGQGIGLMTHRDGELSFHRKSGSEEAVQVIKGPGAKEAYLEAAEAMMQRLLCQAPG